ncbi:MAG TPA: hypothetical protein VL126_04710 [Bacteroidota bacterium]|nr:hypothetical protein [Bacteroidota bacterium]
MLPSHGAHKFDRVTVTLLSTEDDRSFRSVPSTFSLTNQTYQWKKGESVNYMIVPRRVTGAKIEIDVFLEAAKGGKLQKASLQKVVQDLLKGKIASEWKGLKLGAVGRAGSAVPPRRSLLRGSIEDILGVAFNR